MAAHTQHSSYHSKREAHWQERRAQRAGGAQLRRSAVSTARLVMWCRHSGQGLGAHAQCCRALAPALQELQEPRTPAGVTKRQAGARVGRLQALACRTGEGLPLCTAMPARHALRWQPLRHLSAPPLLSLLYPQGAASQRARQVGQVALGHCQQPLLSTQAPPRAGMRAKRLKGAQGAADAATAGQVPPADAPAAGKRSRGSDPHQTGPGQQGAALQEPASPRQPTGRPRRRQQLTGGARGRCAERQPRSEGAPCNILPEGQPGERMRWPVHRWATAEARPCRPAPCTALTRSSSSPSWAWPGPASRFTYKHVHQPGHEYQHAAVRQLVRGLPAAQRAACARRVVKVRPAGALQAPPGVHPPHATRRKDGWNTKWPQGAQEGQGRCRARRHCSRRCSHHLAHIHHAGGQGLRVAPARRAVDAHPRTPDRHSAGCVHAPACLRHLKPPLLRRPERPPVRRVRGGCQPRQPVDGVQGFLVGARAGAPRACTDTQALAAPQARGHGGGHICAQGSRGRRPRREHRHSLGRPIRGRRLRDPAPCQPVQGTAAARPAGPCA